MYIVQTLGPLFLIVGFGAVLRKAGFFDAAVQAGMNRLCYWIALPSLLFLKIGQSPPTGGSALTVSILVLLVTAALVVAALLAAWALRLPMGSVGTFIQAAFRGNLAFIGLPVVIFAFDGTGHSAVAEGTAALALGPIIVVYNILSVLVLLMSRRRHDGGVWRRMAHKIVTNPLLLACAAGLLWNWGVVAAGLTLPAAPARALALLGNVALPLALLCVGGTLVSTPLHKGWLPAATASLLKVAAGPLFCLLAARGLGADPIETAVAAILAATPTAVASYVITDQLDGNTGLAASSIVISTILSAISLATVLAIMG